MPFTLQPVVDKDFVNRKEIISEMLKALSDKRSSVGFALYGKRRIGKTSILKEVNRRLKQKEGVVPVYFSVWDMVGSTVGEFVKELSGSIIEAYSPFLSLKYKVKDLLKAPITLLKDILRGTKIGLKLKDEIELLLTFSLDEKREPSGLVDKVFNMPESLATETNTKCVLMIDEFPSIIDLRSNGKVGEGIVRKIRTIQENYKHTALCISGSVRKTMNIVALSSVSAFYKQFVIREIGPLGEKDVGELIKRDLGKFVSKNVVKTLYALSGGNPFYIQAVGRLLERKRTKIKEKDIMSAFQEFLNEEGDIIFKEEMKKLSPKERSIVISMATRNITKLGEIAHALRDNLNTIGRFMIYLDDKAILRKIGKGTYDFEDPIFKKWLAKKYC